MRGMRGWIAIAVVAIAIAGGAYLLQPRQSDSPEHSTNSDAPNGASAALLFAQAMGHPVDQLAGAYSLPADPTTSTMFVFSPTSQFTPDEADRARAWVSNGGTLIYASEQGDPELDRAFDVRRLSSSEYSATYFGVPVMAGVKTVATGQAVTPLDPSLEQVSFLRTGAGSSVGFFQHIGFGTVYVLADPLVLCNAYLGVDDNGRLLANLLPSDPAARVVFDEYHHGLTVSDFTPQAWLLTPWGFGLLWLIVAVFFAFFLRGRRFGPLVPRPAEIARSEAEWSVAIGELLRRSGARNVALGLLATATERAVAARTGLPLQPRERFWNALWVRAPQTASELADVENSLQALSQTGVSEREVLQVARRLHRIAHPTPGAR